MTLLAIDTATEIASVALLKDSNIYALEQVGTRQHAQHLLPMIQTLLQEHQVIWSELKGIVMNSGPGSFTGLRISCSIAKALAYAHNLPIFSVTSMEALAFQAREKNPNMGILAAGDARMQEIYWAYYPPGIALHTIEVQVDPVQAVRIADCQPIVLVGWGLKQYQEQWSAILQAQFIEQDLMYPKAETLIRIVQSEQRPSMSAIDALPLYVRNQVVHSGESHG